MECLIAAIIVLVMAIVALLRLCLSLERQYDQIWGGGNLPAAKNRRQSSRWADMSDAERRAKFESECG